MSQAAVMHRAGSAAGGTAMWWQPQGSATPRGPRGTAKVLPSALDGSAAAFSALVAFTFVLLLSPQARFPVLKLIPIPLLAGFIAIAAHVMARTPHTQPITPMPPEIGLALAPASSAARSNPT